MFMQLSNITPRFLQLSDASTMQPQIVRLLIIRLGEGESFSRSLAKPVGAGPCHMEGGRREIQIPACHHLAPSLLSLCSSLNLNLNLNGLRHQEAVQAGACLQCPARPSTKACKAYNEGKYTNRAAHPDHLHMYTQCLTMVNPTFPHPEKDCNRKRHGAAQHA